MRLLNTKSLWLSEFYGDAIPPYAILSHRWGPEEVTFDDLTKGLASTRYGFHKLRGFCEQAASDGFEYCWIDTCCIDKSSSAELSEAINSMWTWYRNAQVCIVYLQDVESSPDQALLSVPESFRSSSWFSRGWTLQELIAPVFVSFHGSDWGYLGSRITLESVICEVTKINPICFGYHDLSQFPVAQRMSWAANRQTTRIEDQAYCLMGLFGINMPLLYGEGENAFRRLQEEIIRRSTDHSIFATPRMLAEEHFDSILASSPAAFTRSGRIRALPTSEYRSFQVNDGTAVLADYGATITNRGIVLTLPFLRQKLNGVLPWIQPFGAALGLPGEAVAAFRTPDTWVALLNCSIETFILGILLEENPNDSGVFRKCDVVLVDPSIANNTQLRNIIVSTGSSMITHRPNFTQRIALETCTHIQVEFPKSTVSGFSFAGLHGITAPEWYTRTTTTRQAILSPRIGTEVLRRGCVLLFKSAEAAQDPERAQTFYLKLKLGLTNGQLHMISRLDLQDNLEFGGFASNSPGVPETVMVPRGDDSASLVRVIVRRGLRRWIVKVSITSAPWSLDGEWLEID